MSWKKTLNLPATAFPMKADLVRREPDIQARWAEADLYGQIRTERAGKPRRVLHDGPPYANGGVHLGTGRNKVLKDMVARHATMTGHDSPYVPGWDCHGMPIEHNVMKKLGKQARDMSKLEIRRQCAEYAAGFIDVQRDAFKRYGVLGDWERPYRTMDPEYEAGVLDVFAEMVDRGYISRGLRSIHWCVTCTTALAEFEIEYGPETSPSIHVRFAVDAAHLEAVGGAPTDVVIWTTTPWTLPANVAVAVHPELDYAVVEHDGPDREQRAIVAVARVEAYLAAVGGVDHTIPLVMKGRDLVGMKLAHPFLDRVVPVVEADYVTADDGTGLVHTAPGHGADDFATGKRLGLELLCPVGPNGVYTDEVGDERLVGQHVFKANALVLDILRETGSLAAHEDFEHSYPHCWRCKRKLIFRATDQWFIGVDHEGLRERTLAACREAQFFPARTLGRITAMIQDRPDWCISRQRSWGVPIPAFYCNECDAVQCNGDLARHVRDLFAQHGTDTWFEREAADLVPADFACSQCGASSPRKETDIFDVWFEAGSSWRSVCEERDLGFPVGVYLEGHDQHRGWFQASALLAIAVRGELPFEHCVTHGFFINESGEKVSKSKGGMKELSAERVFGTIGVDIVRLFFVSGDYADEVPVSFNLVKPAGEQYRKVRNTLRFMLGSLEGFDPATDTVAAAELEPIDRWALGQLDTVIEETSRHYGQYTYHRASTVLRTFMDRTLSGFYLDLLKDRLYCTDGASPERRSAQTALHRLTSVLTRLWAPVLVHTAEEAWAALPGNDGKSVHLAAWPDPTETRDPALDELMAFLLSVRTEIQRKADVLRKAKVVGGGQDLRVSAKVDDAQVADLPDVFGAARDESQLEILGVAAWDLGGEGELEATELPWLQLSVSRSDLPKCDRCRRRRSGVTGPEGDALCTRCEPWRDQRPRA